MRTYYEELEVSRTASPEVIRAAYRQLMQMYHPDKNPDNPASATEASSRVNRAYEVLSDPELRAAYDSFLREQEPSFRAEPPPPPPPPETPRYTVHPEPRGATGRTDPVAFWHRFLVLSAAADLVTAFALGDDFVWLRLLLLPVYVLAYFKLAKALGRSPWLYLLLGIIPILNLVVLLVLVRAAYAYYAAHGLRTRFFGGAMPRGA